MNLRSPAQAICWEIWHRHRATFTTLLVGMALGSFTCLCIGANHSWTHVVESTAFVLLGPMLLALFGSFHFTEGRKKGGFGSFPLRLLTMPVATRRLVALPMVLGSLAVLAAYTGAAWFIFHPLGRRLPILWPCLYLIFGFTQYQMIVWSLPESRYWKLLSLSLSATTILIGWMFFLPNVVEGTLAEWGYTGSSRTFLRSLLAVLSMTGPLAYAVSVHRVHRQRHGLYGNSQGFGNPWERIGGNLFCRKTKFHSAEQAIVWQEWRQTGFILPITVVVILAMICIPTYLSGPLGVRATVAVLLGLLIAPILLAAIIGCGYAKPDFWNPSLRMTPFHAVRPLTPGQWVASKWIVAFWSVALTWAVVTAAAALWMVYGGDFLAFESELKGIRFYYSPSERVLLLILSFITMIILTWRLLTRGLSTGLSGHKSWYYVQNAFTAIALIWLLTFLIWRDHDPERDSELFKFWPWITRLPLALGLAVIIKVTLAFFAWNTVHKRHLLSAKSIATYFGCWIAATTVSWTLASVACEHTPWLRALLRLISLLWVPLCGPALAILALAKNRSN